MPYAAVRSQIRKMIEFEKGAVHIEGPTLSETIRELGIDDGLKAFRPAWRQKEALEEIAGLEDGWVVAAHFGAIEVAPGFRNIKLGRAMMEVAFADTIMEEFIVISTEYYWHWDLDGTGLNVWEYQQVMTKLMEGVGMVKCETDEQEICAHPANMLMVRTGKNVGAGASAAFERLLFLKKKS
mgnify:CR=1 FL=1